MSPLTAPSVLFFLHDHPMIDPLKFCRGYREEDEGRRGGGEGVDTVGFSWNIPPGKAFCLLLPGDEQSARGRTVWTALRFRCLVFIVFLCFLYFFFPSVLSRSLFSHVLRLAFCVFVFYSCVFNCYVYFFSSLCAHYRSHGRVKRVAVVDGDHGRCDDDLVMSRMLMIVMTMHRSKLMKRSWAHTVARVLFSFVFVFGHICWLATDRLKGVCEHTLHPNVNQGV